MNDYSSIQVARYRVQIDLTREGYPDEPLGRGYMWQVPVPGNEVSTPLMHNGEAFTAEVVGVYPQSGPQREYDLRVVVEDTRNRNQRYREFE